MIELDENASIVLCTESCEITINGDVTIQHPETTSIPSEACSSQYNDDP